MTGSHHPRFLLVNPPIYDFSAFDLWGKPLGLLHIAAVLADAGAQVRLFDFMDRLHPAAGTPDSDQWGCGHYPVTEIPKPRELKTIPRRYKRYGLPLEAFRVFIAGYPAPDAILVTSGMTYWYPGVQEVIREIKERFPKAPVILGGTYATLCADHAARTSGADHVVAGYDIRTLFTLLGNLYLLPKGSRCPAHFSDFPPPLYDLYPRLEYAALRTTLGCPFRCSYCAASVLGPGSLERKMPEKTAGEIAALAARGIRAVAFYDDALLIDAQDHLIPMLKAVREKNTEVSFHSPNGLHARCLTPELARLMHEVNFILPRLSLETASDRLQRETGDKVRNGEFSAACGYLREAGYPAGGFAAYVLLGMPGQDLAGTERTIRFAHATGARVLVAEYSPIPGTDDWEKVKNDLPSFDPLWHNNSLFPLFPLSAWPRVQKLKDLARELNRNFSPTL